jgi:hypothetical protein
MKTAIAKHVPPMCGKNHSFQVYFPTPEQREKILITMRSDEVKDAHPFLQGDQREWLMVEFWTANLDLIKASMKRLADSIGAELGYGSFTREELGLA